MQQHAAAKAAIAERSTPNRRLAFSCGSAATRATRRPLHLLLFDEAFTHQLVHRRLREGRAADPDARAE